jgi:hypothetical protein
MLNRIYQPPAFRNRFLPGASQLAGPGGVNAAKVAGRLCRHASAVGNMYAHYIVWQGSFNQGCS